MKEENSGNLLNQNFPHPKIGFLESHRRKQKIHIIAGAEMNIHHLHLDIYNRGTIVRCNFEWIVNQS